MGLSINASVIEGQVILKFCKEKVLDGIVHSDDKVLSRPSNVVIR